MILFRNIRERLSSFELTIARRSAKIRRRLDAAPPVLILQMGKVGSPLLKDSVAPIWPGLTIQTHNLMRDRRQSKSLTLVYDDVIRKRRPVFLIIPLRDPISKNIASFFENFGRHTGVKYEESTFSLEELIRIFLQKVNHHAVLSWFDNHLKPVFGIDVYNYDFPPNGIQVIHHRNTKLLLMRSELPAATKQSAVREFLNMPEFVLSTAHDGVEKEYAATHKQFTEAFIAPDWYLRKMYESRYFNHFYSPTDKEKLIKKWAQDPNCPP